MDNILISEVSIKIRLDNEGEVIFKTVKHCPRIIILTLTNTQQRFSIPALCQACAKNSVYVMLNPPSHTES